LVVIDLANGAGHLSSRESKEEERVGLPRLLHLTWLDLANKVFTGDIPVIQ
jgi:hypothetical protein